jgi:hypothetical protein
MTDQGALEQLGLTLPVGFQYNGTPFSSFEFGVVRGRMRRELADEKNPHTQTVISLEHALSKIGALPVDRDVVRRLPYPDVEYIQLALTAHRGGTELYFAADCAGMHPDGKKPCGASMQRIRVDLNEVALVPGQGVTDYDKLGRPYQTIVFDDPVDGRTIRVLYRMALLSDYEELFRERKKVGDLQGTLLHYQIECLMLDYDGRGKGLTSRELDDLPADTYDALLTAAGNVRPRHVDVDVVTTCAQCGTTQIVELPVWTWLLPFGGRPPSGT